MEQPLRGFVVGVTAERRREELVNLLERRGAQVMQAPALRLVPLPDNQQLLAATSEVIEARPDVVVATTGVGFRAWMATAEGWGFGDQLHRRLEAAQIVARGPKATGAIRGAG